MQPKFTINKTFDKNKGTQGRMDSIIQNQQSDRRQMYFACVTKSATILSRIAKSLTLHQRQWLYHREIITSMMDYKFKHRPRK